MPTPEQTEFLAYLDQLIAATSSGSVDWMRVNPTTFAWDTKTPSPAKLTLQRVDRQQTGVVGGRPGVILKRYYVFQAIDARLAQPRLSINGTEDEAVNGKLEKLYETISGGISRRALEFLKSLLPPQTQGQT